MYNARLPFVVLGAFIFLSAALSGCATSQGPAFDTKDVTFRNGEVALSGTFITPVSKAPHPAIVFLHGSGPATRAGARVYAEAFAELGIASLFFDKRGSGESGGSWLTSSLDDLAGDALAAVTYLKAQDTVDPDQIGFWGVSQAGWVATLAASQSDDVAFMIIISGGGASPRESEMFSYESAFTRADLSDADVIAGRRAVNLYFDYLETGQDRASLVKMLDGARESAWYPFASLDRILPSEENRENWRWVAAWDPDPHTERITTPVLLMFGDLDTNHPTEAAISKWREGLEKAGNEDVQIVVFPGAGHGIRMRAGHDSDARPPFADGYHELMLGWLWRHVVNEY